MIFAIGGVLPLILIPVVLFWLPESPRFLLKKGAPDHSDPSAHCGDLKIETEQAGHTVDVATGNPVAGLFRDGLAPTTVLVWILYFCQSASACI